MLFRFSFSRIAGLSVLAAAIAQTSCVLEGTGDRQAGAAEDPREESKRQAQLDLAVFIYGNPYSIGDELIAIRERVKKNAVQYNQILYNEYLSVRSPIEPANLNSCHMSVALEELSRWDLAGSLANARAWQKLNHNSLFVYDMIRDHDKLLGILDLQDDIDDGNEVRRLVQQRKEIERLIAKLEKNQKSSPK